jgi:hypothetical protein
MNIDSVTTTTMLVFSSFSLSLSVLFQTTATTIVDLYSHIWILLPAHARTFFFTFSRGFFLPLSPSLTLVSFQFICVELAMYACMYIMMVEKNLCIFLYTTVVLPLIQSILACIPVFLHRDGELGLYIDISID